jgi:hypothetical protein
MLFQQQCTETYYTISSNNIYEFIESEPSIEEIENLLGVYLNDECIIIIIEYLKKEIFIAKLLKTYLKDDSLISVVLKYLNKNNVIQFSDLYINQLNDLYNYFREKLKEPYDPWEEKYPKILSEKEKNGEEGTFYALGTSYHWRHRDYQKPTKESYTGYGTGAKILTGKIDLYDVCKDSNNPEFVEIAHMLCGKKMDVWYCDD